MLIQQALNTTISEIHQGASLPEIINMLDSLKNESIDMDDRIEEYILYPSDSMELPDGVRIDLKKPLDTLLKDVWDSSKYKLSISAAIVEFDPVKKHHLSIDDKRKICMFLQEAITNIKKHSEDAQRIRIVGKQSHDSYTITIEDNGSGTLNLTSKGKGTNQAEDLAKKLGGQFNRCNIQPKGVRCTLEWRTR